MPKPPRTPPRVILPDITVMRFCPIPAMRLSTSALAPVPMLTPTMTAAMPTIMPSMVRKDRSTLRRMAIRAMRRVANMGQGLSWTAFCSASSFWSSSRALRRAVTGASLRTRPSRMTTMRLQ